MKKSILILIAAVLLIPAMVMAQYRPHPGNFNHNGGFNNPGHGAVPVHPGHGNNNGYNNNGNNNNHHGHPGNNSGYNNNNNNNNNHHGHPGNNSGYNKPGYNKPGHGNPGYNSPANARIRLTHREIKRAFQDAENSFYPFLMDQKDKRRMAMAIRTLVNELNTMLGLVDRRHKDEIREVSFMAEKARFALVSENDAKGANRILQRAEFKYSQVAERIIGR